MKYEALLQGESGLTEEINQRVKVVHGFYKGTRTQYFRDSGSLAVTGM
jgi:hypothetical protein